ncbi:hypothetical protein EV401DRAFT_2073648 [Pisolithus croceorrhizus]|nr:hypothetical protein EV401DRAFT_2073648 [Pisolithus croceorrhizus]
MSLLANSGAYPHIADELNEARAELCRLQETERTFLKQLVEIRAAVKVQKCKIDELVKKRPPAINRLPIELLSRIMFQSLPTYDDHRVSREYLELANYRTNLSTVSRRWRNVVLGTPELWSEILRRSCEVPLNITIMNWFYDGSEEIQPWLDVLFSSANRWRCLHVFDVHHGLANIFHTIEARSLEFPSLKDVHVDIHGESTYLRFLLPNRAPALRNWELLNFVPTSEFATATTLTSLRLTFNNYLSETIITPIPLIIPAQSLTMLSLTGGTTA